MVLETRFTRLVGCTVPIQQAGMGAAGRAELTAAVSEAGGLGMLGCAFGESGPDAIAEQLTRARALTSEPVGANFIIVDDAPPIDPACFETAASLARVVEFFLWSAPDARVIELVHHLGALVSCQVGSAEEAKEAAGAGADMIVAQAYEAGGHVRGTVGLLPLLGEVLDAVDVPVLAAGGIGTARAMAGALAAGADGVRVGTRFVASNEAWVHPGYKQGLIDAQARDSLYTRVFSVGWDAPHRVLRSAVAAAEAFEGDIVGERVQWWDGARVPVRRFAPGMPFEGTTGAVEAMALWAGESVGGVTQVQPAADIVRELAEGAECLLRRWS
jgi:nitronate monooxygenase